MQDALQSPGKCSYILIKTKDGVAAEEVAQKINDKLPGNKIQFTRDVVTNVEKSIPYLGIFLRALVALAAIVSALVVMLAMYTTITERTREIGVLKALGASRVFIVSLIEQEAFLISLIGLVAGFAISLAAGFVIHRAYGLMFEYGWRWALVAAAIGVGGGLLGALYPAMRAASLDAVTALSYE
jgi:putative ABC transport system permease protein